MAMSADRALAIAFRVASQILREPRTIGLIVGVPAAVMGLVSVSIPDLKGPGGVPIIDSLAPGLLGAFAFFFVFVLTGVSFLRERTLGTMERLLASPASRIEIVTGYMLGFLFFGMAQAVIVSLFTIFVLDIRYKGAVWEIALFEVAVVVAAVNLGILASAFARNELQVVQFIPLLIAPQFLLAGLFWPVSAMPGALQGLSVVLPMTYAVRGLRALMLEGAGLNAVAFDLGILAAFAAGFSLAAAVAIRRAA